MPCSASGTVVDLKVDMLRSMQQATQQDLTQAQHMLHDMQHRYDRLLEAPSSPPAPTLPATRAPLVDATPRGEIRRALSRCSRTTGRPEPGADAAAAGARRGPRQHDQGDGAGRAAPGRRDEEL